MSDDQINDGQRQKGRSGLLVAIGRFGLVVGLLFVLFGGGCFLFFVFGFLQAAMSGGSVPGAQALPLVFAFSSVPVLIGWILIRAARKTLK